MMTSPTTPTKENDGRSYFQRRQLFLRLLTVVVLFSTLVALLIGSHNGSLTTASRKPPKEGEPLVSMNRLRRMIHQKKGESKKEGTTKVAPPVHTLSNDDDSFITVEFTVGNVDGMDHSKEGTFVVQTRPKWAPLGARRFAELSRASFWDDCFFFRVLPHFIAQFGISGTPAIQQKWRSQPPLPDDPVVESNQRGTVTFATSGKNTRTTQLFINTGQRNAFLDKQGFSPFAQVIRGMDVVDRLYNGYGEGKPQGNGPNQGKIQQQGNVYLRNEFPRLSYIKRAVIVDPKNVLPDNEEDATVARRQ